MPTTPYFMCFTGEGGPPAAAAQDEITATVGAAVPTTAATSSTPFGYAQAQADAIVARINQLRVDDLAIVAQLAEIRAVLVASGMLKGSA